LTQSGGSRALHDTCKPPQQSSQTQPRIKIRQYCFGVPRQRWQEHVACRLHWWHAACMLHSDLQLNPPVPVARCVLKPGWLANVAGELNRHFLGRAIATRTWFCVNGALKSEKLKRVLRRRQHCQQTLLKWLSAFGRQIVVQLMQQTGLYCWGLHVGWWGLPTNIGTVLTTRQTAQGREGRLCSLAVISNGQSI
jgi:hypothetical protein